MDFGNGTGEIDTFWAIPEDIVCMETGPSHTSSPLLIQESNGGKLYYQVPEQASITQQWTNSPFELSLPSPEYDANANQILNAQQPSGLIESEESLDRSREPIDSTDTSFEDTLDGTMLLNDFLNLPFQDHAVSDSLQQLLLMEENPQNHAPGSSGSQGIQRNSIGNPQVVETFNVDAQDPNPHYVRTHPIPPQQRQNWRGFSRRQSISKMPLAQLYQIMGLPHNHSSAKDREERIMGELQKSGFQIGQQTWIRDTEESFRRNVVDRIYQQTKEEYGYSKHLLEAIIRRGTYARMQSNLRRKRRHISRMKRRGAVYD